MEKTRLSSSERQEVSNAEQNMPSIDRLSCLPDAVICHILSFLPTKISVRTSILARRWRFLWAHVPNCDRLSCLPDVVICHILSFLPTKISVRTSILARRWRFLWAHVPNLDFDCMNYVWTNLPYIINRVMLQHKVQSINTFRLLYKFGGCKFEIETWITSAISRNVQNFDLSLRYHLTLPKCLFTCKTLVNLSLAYCVGIPSSGVVSLPSLKKLHLYCVQYQVDEALPHLLSGCPVLEELFIDNIAGGDFGCWNISSPTIKRLTVNIPFDYYEDDIYDYEDYIYNYTVEINAPALRYLRVDDCWYEHISLCPLTSLIEADICLNKDMVEENYDKPLSMLDFLNCLHNVKRLKLSGVYFKFEYMGTTESSRPILKFDNLTKLDLDANWMFLIKFLECADNLEVLIIRESLGAGGNDLEIWMESVEQWPACLYSLRTITFDGFGCTEQEFKMVKYLIRNAKVLKRIEIYTINFRYGFKEDFDVLERISSLQQESEACELVFHRVSLGVGPSRFCGPSDMS